MKQAFSLLELVFVLVILALIGSYAIPKFMNTKDAAIITTVKRDITTILNSIQSQYLLDGKIEDISDTIKINSSNWFFENNSIIYKSNNSNCITIRIDRASQKLKLNINETNDTICSKLKQSGIENSSIDLY
ncbi:prepilin-type cleavage/methylation domain-containing protein [Malaciobacter molluscorum LMG 25693]|uniref:Prepilin-type cleavage/methylation domain-containing protein n=1 Tax=Malaciobacter molluscorum LMG 25693 TaxID=870501 RepID=A0A2G1DFL1_9BACT|nr:prepilin-type N-terminal cleavage/methylation domain-containing protein [Malaciobacter molluscorum]AXX91764.1 type II secretion/transformation system, G protein [Malaciobacter molluscorum LMG 25693]PHO17240.1 prepilin-type cleavage/methylation domain-containing protein [Malaciobacter molluscorum LMG 25693]